MSDRLFLALMAAAAGLIAFAAIWPQGLGARSPGPFGHTPLQQTPAMQAAMAREAAKAQKKFKVQTDAASAQLRRIASTPPPPAAPSATSSAPSSVARPNSAAATGLRPDQ